MPNAPEKSSIIIDGNITGPNPYQLREIKTILKNLDILWAKIDDKLNKESDSLSFSEKEKFRNWRSIFYLAAIYSIGDNTNFEFEICFETIDSYYHDYMIFSYSNGKLNHMEISAPS